MRILPFLLLATALASCAGQPRTMASMTALEPMILADASSATSDYRIGVSDLLNVTVFQIEDLSAKDVRVDSSGNIQLPLLGSVPAATLTTPELAENIRARLAQSYLQNPAVTVVVSESASQKITVDGAVNEAGVYEMKGRTTLMQAVAMAKGVSQIADRRSVAVFRSAGGQRTVAVFDLEAIRDGRAVDPALQGDDIVVVDTSRMSANLRNIISVLPAFSVFRPY